MQNFPTVQHELNGKAIRIHLPDVQSDVPVTWDMLTAFAHESIQRAFGEAVQFEGALHLTIVGNPMAKGSVQKFAIIPSHPGDPMFVREVAATHQILREFDPESARRQSREDRFAEILAALGREQRQSRPLTSDDVRRIVRSELERHDEEILKQIKKVVDNGAANRLARAAINVFKAPFVLVWHIILTPFVILGFMVLQITRFIIRVINPNPSAWHRSFWHLLICPSCAGSRFGMFIRRVWHWITVTVPSGFKKVGKKKNKK